MHHVKQTTQIETRSVLASLRQLTPARDLLFSEALRIAELQAGRLRKLTEIDGNEMPESVMHALPRIHIVRRSLPTSGLSYWDGTCWVIALNSRESEARQRFTLFHEYKHIIDHGRVGDLYVGDGQRSRDERAEQAADYFAGCVLLPKRLVKRAWGTGTQTPKKLATLFDVSPRCAEVRLAQLGLTDPATRCGNTQSAPKPRRSFGRRYYRSLSLTPPLMRIT